MIQAGIIEALERRINKERITVTNSKHTPTPWHLETTSVWEGICSTVARVGGIQILAGKSLQPYEDKENKANAAFIIGAVNNHEYLLEACKKANRRLGEIYNRQHRTDENLKVLLQLEKAIANAEAK